MRNFARILLIIGTVIGSGFSSGKEIVVYFSRFGKISFLFVLLAALLFFVLFYLILKFGEVGIGRLENNKFALILSIFIGLVFTSSMMAGSFNIMHCGSFILDLIFMFFLVLACVVVSQKGVGFLSKINTYLIPFTLIALFVCLAKNIFAKSVIIENNFNDFYSGLFFCILYVVLNTALSCLVIGRIGKGLSKKSMLTISAIACLILGLFLMIINCTLIKNPDVFVSSMPLLEICTGNANILMKIVVLFGCLTTLFSLVFTTSKSLEKLGCCQILSIIICVILPFVLSFIGFSLIVTWVYPLCSILGIFLLFLFLPFKVKKI